MPDDERLDGVRRDVQLDGVVTVVDRVGRAVPYDDAVHVVGLDRRVGQVFRQLLLLALPMVMSRQTGSEAARPLNAATLTIGTEAVTLVELLPHVTRGPSAAWRAESSRSQARPPPKRARSLAIAEMVT